MKRSRNCKPYFCKNAKVSPGVGVRRQSIMDPVSSQPRQRSFKRSLVNIDSFDGDMIELADDTLQAEPATRSRPSRHLCRVALVTRRWAAWLHATTRALPVLVIATSVQLMAGDTATRATGFVDLHAHTAGIGAGGSGVFIGYAMQDSVRFSIYLRAFGVTREALEEGGDGIVIDRIATHVAASERVERAVVLALDGVVDASGNLDRDATQVYVPNDFVARETARHAELCFGASVNPYRHDALEQLVHVRDAGAVLVKWIPNIMDIDPADEAIRPFYERLAALDLPLLTHTGQERSFESAVDAYGDPLRLQLPLSLGVTVIAAHMATTGENHGQDNFERILPLFDRYPNLYADVSSLSQINKLGYLARALKAPGLPERLVYGTDWPLQFFPLVSPYYHLNHIGLAKAQSVAAFDNPWDRDVALKEALLVPHHVFARSAALLPMERCEGTIPAS